MVLLHPDRPIVDRDGRLAEAEARVTRGILQRRRIEVTVMVGNELRNLFHITGQVRAAEPREFTRYVAYSTAFSGLGLNPAGKRVEWEGGDSFATNLACRLGHHAGPG